MEQEITFYDDASYKFHEAPPLPTQDDSDDSVISEKKENEVNVKLETDNAEDEGSDDNYEIGASNNKPSRQN